MIPPIVCPSCGFLIGEHLEDWQKHYKKTSQKSIEEQSLANVRFFESIRMKRYCCRNALANYVEVTKDLNRAPIEKSVSQSN